jgi:hypothetical protein
MSAIDVKSSSFDKSVSVHQPLIAYPVALAHSGALKSR